MLHARGLLLLVGIDYAYANVTVRGVPGPAELMVLRGQGQTVKTAACVCTSKNWPPI